MKKQEPSYIKGRLKAFKHAFNGLRILFKEERNVPIYGALSVVALLMGYWLHISPMEWIIVCGVIGLVFAMEAMNSAVATELQGESNRAKKEQHPS